MTGHEQWEPCDERTPCAFIGAEQVRWCAVHADPLPKDRHS